MPASLASITTLRWFKHVTPAWASVPAPFWPAHFHSCSNSSNAAFIDSIASICQPLYCCCCCCCCYPCLQDGLGPRVSLFLSDVETDTWSQQQLDAVSASCDRVIITLGEKGALLLPNGSSSSQQQHIPVVKVSKQQQGAGRQ
jgi:hypothetical protein